MADFLQAVQWMKKGKRVRQSHWIPDAYVEYIELYNMFVQHVQSHDYYGAQFLGMSDFSAQDWEIAE